jgi:peptide deformylase
MKIITVPHPTLRTVAEPITVVDKKVLQFIEELKKTLALKRNPRGVGIAAPQVNIKWRAFATFLPPNGETNEDQPAVLRSFINPKIIDKATSLTFGPDKRDPVLEGCFSIPGIWGPVPRAPWVRLEYQEIIGNELVTKTERFSDFAARVVLHEYDHLEGIIY